MADPVRPGRASEPAPFSGVGVALVTLFDDDRNVDLDANAALAAELAAAGMRSIVIAGSTGEAATLDAAERVALVKVVREAIPADVPIIVGTGAPSARQAARLTAEVVAGGADAVLALSPPGSADPTEYYAEVVRAAGATPVLGYHFPAMSSPGIDLAVLRRLTDVGVVGLKDSSGDPARLVRTLETFAGHLYVGSPWLLSAAGPLGATGAILAVANVEPALSVAAFAGDPAAQRALATAATSAAGPRGVKAVLGRSQVSRVA
jgi:4-hydroxy-tetrahydrodipicolinate synthase